VSRIFINYRREDASGSASRIYEWISEAYGDYQVFMDVDTIEPGLDWMLAIDRAVGQADLVLALIGTDWLAELNRRIAKEPDDPMRHELETALSREIRVIPVLVEGAKMPRADELPESLVPLTRRHAFEALRPGDERFRVDKQDLLALVARALGEPLSGPPPPPPPPPPADEKDREDTSDERIHEAVLKVELTKWNWGAFLLTWIWGLSHGYPRSLLTWIPFYGLYEWYRLGRYGNKIAWATNRWKTVDAFRAAQRKWAIWGIAVDAVVIVVWLVFASASGSNG
jgi:hypothetical protein